MLTLQQDNHSKIKVTTEEANVIAHLKKFFKWRKDVTVKRMYQLGSSDYDRFVEYLSKAKQC